MGRAATADLTDQYQRAFRMLYDEITRFSEEQWAKGIDFFQVPIKVAMHRVASRCPKLRIRKRPSA